MDLTEKEIKDFVATSMLVVYSNGTNKYLETHEIVDGKPLAGKPMSIESVNSLRATLGDVDGNSLTSFKGQIPSNLLYIDSDPTQPILIWWTIANPRKLYFGKDTEVPSKTMDVPPMIWMLKKDELSVFFANVIHNQIQNIFYAAFPNVHSDDTVCMGNVKIKTDYDDLSKIMKHIENSFFNSEFNTIHHQNACKINIYDMWRGHYEWEAFVKHEQYKNIKELINDNKN